MADCEFHLHLSAYHDRELDAETSRRIESHLAVCPACLAELAGMRDLSTRISAAVDGGRTGEIAPRESARIHLAVDRAGEDAPLSMPLLRTAGLLTALAASILIISGVWLLETRTAQGDMAVRVPVGQSVALAPDWERVATTLRADPRAGENSMFYAIDWMLNNLVQTERKPWAKPNSS